MQSVNQTELLRDCMISLELYTRRQKEIYFACVRPHAHVTYTHIHSVGKPMFRHVPG